MFKKWWNYIKAWFTKKSNDVMDPEIEIEQAIQDAQKKDQQLRNQAAQVIAHRTQVAGELEDAAGDVAEAKELAKQALLKADASTKAGNAADAREVERGGQHRGHEVAGGTEHRGDVAQATDRWPTSSPRRRRRLCRPTPPSVQQLAAKRMELLGQLEAAKMQEKVNDAMSSMTATVGQDSPSLEEVENKIQARMAQASAKAELDASTGEGALAELKKSTMELEASATLDSLRAELGWALRAAGRPQPPGDRRPARRPARQQAPAERLHPVIVLVLGGTRSGKSAVAEALATRLGPPVTYVATASADRRRRGHGRAHRRPPGPATGRLGDRGSGRRPRRRAAQLPRRHAAGGRARDRGWPRIRTSPSTSASLVAALQGRPGPTVVVSEEVGLSVHAPTELGRRFADVMGTLNQAVAAVADRRATGGGRTGAVAAAARTVVTAEP